MKNNRLIASWNIIEPDDSANERMLSAILEQNRSAQDEKNNVKHISKAKKVLIPAAVCLALLIAVTGIIGGNSETLCIKKNAVYTVELTDGESIIYQPGSTGIKSFDFNYPTFSRKLTEVELDAIFPATAELQSAIGMFRESDGTLIRVEGEIDDVKVVFASHGIPVVDVIIEGDEAVSTVNGISVASEYFVTEPNSMGKQNILFFGSFRLGNTNVYVECTGDESDINEVSQKASELILKTIENGEPKLSAVKK